MSFSENIKKSQYLFIIRPRWGRDGLYGITNGMIFCCSVVKYFGYFPELLLGLNILLLQKQILACYQDNF
jgi:hypothetical protein